MNFSSKNSYRIAPGLVSAGVDEAIEGEEANTLLIEKENEVARQTEDISIKVSKEERMRLR